MRHLIRRNIKEFVGNVCVGILLISLPFDYVLADTNVSVCHSLLWPAKSGIIDPSFVIPIGLIDELQHWSLKQLNRPSHPLAVLGSSGKIRIKDPLLIASRRAFQDADEAAVLALTYRLTHRMDYFNKARDILLDWSKINQPTGNPIDETNLDGMIWAYDLIACNLSFEEKTQILGWFERMYTKKRAWKFGAVTQVNNHRIHQLKMLLLLDKVLKKASSLQKDIETAERLSKINLDPLSGKSIDYTERTALYYHNYVMQPWLEIRVITDCCQKQVDKGFAFLSKKILSHQIGGEFSHSQAAIDTFRAKGGFDYVVKGGTFDVKRAVPTIITYNMIARVKPDPKVLNIVYEEKLSARILFLNARSLLWKS